MKRCPACEQEWEDELLFCPDDNNLLEQLEGPEPEVAVPEEEPEAPAGPPRRATGSAAEDADAGSLVDVALGAIERRRIRDREQMQDRMRQIEKYNTYDRAVLRFVHDLRAKSDRFDYHVDNVNEDARMRATFTLSVGAGLYRRSFPIRVTYYRDLGNDVTIEVDLEQVGTNRDERIMRTEELGGRALNTRFGWTFLLLAPRDLEQEDDVVVWLEQAFRAIFSLAYSSR